MNGLEIFFVFLLGSLVGLCSGLFGIGGAFLVSPFLNLIFGLPMPVCVGTAAFQGFGTSAISLVQQIDRRLLGARIAMILVCGIPVGVFIGGFLLEYLKDFGSFQYANARHTYADVVLLSLFTVMLTCLAVFMPGLNARIKNKESGQSILARIKLRPTMSFRTLNEEGSHLSLPVLFFLGIGVGVLSGLMGIGGGVVLLPTLTLLVGQQPMHATRTTMIVTLVGSAFAATLHGFKGNVDFGVLPMLLLGAIIGSRTGSVVKRKMTDEHLRRGFIAVVSVSAIITAGKLVAMFT